MKTTQQQQAIRNDFEKDDEFTKNCYLLSPAIGKRKTIGGKHRIYAKICHRQN